MINNIINIFIIIFLKYYILFNNSSKIVLFQINFNSLKTVELYGNKFPPIKVYCYNLSDRFQPYNQLIRDTINNPDAYDFQFYIEVEFHKELLLSPILTKNPEEADLYYIPVYLRAMHYNNKLKRLNFSDIINELRQKGPWFDIKNGADHIITSGWDIHWYGTEFLQNFLKTEIILCALNPIFHNSWKNYSYKRFIVIPFVSYFPNYSFESINWERTRKNKVFLAQTLYPDYKTNNLRSKLQNIIKKIEKHDLILFVRNPYNISKTVQTLPNHYMNSDFCICPKGDNGIAKRNYDSVFFGCIPVYVSDDLALPFSGNLLNYSKFAIHISEKDIDLIPQILNRYSENDIFNMRKELKKCAKLYLFRLGEKPKIGEAFWAISWMLYIRFIYSLQFDFKYKKNFSYF